MGIGSDINATQLQLVASEPTALHYFNAAEYTQLYKIIDRIVDNSCVVCDGNLDSVRSWPTTQQVMGPSPPSLPTKPHSCWDKS